MSGPIAKAWQSYREMAMAPDAGQVQVVETRRAFYAGALTLFTSVMNGLTPDPEPTPADLAMMDAIDAELKAFQKEAEAGRA